MISQHDIKIAPSAAFWKNTVQALIQALPHLLGPIKSVAAGTDFSGLRIVVPTLLHVTQLQSALHDALAQTIGAVYIAPRICTMAGWLALQPLENDSDEASERTNTRIASADERLMRLYAELRQHVWLKKLFSARRNTDLLPLAQTLLALADELTSALLPAMMQYPEHAEERWEAALAQLPASARSLLSEEAQLVWTIWKSQLDAQDPGVASLKKMMHLAATANVPLVWISPAGADPHSEAFLLAWSQRQPVLKVDIDWSQQCLPWVLGKAWPEILGTSEFDALVAHPPADNADGFPPLAHIAVSPACSLEDEASRGAQTIIDWLEEGKDEVAIVVLDRVVARRLRALLQRAQVQVSDESGWKLSTTRAAAALIAWFDVVTTRAQNTALLDFLKSPFLLHASEDNAELVTTIEVALRRGNVAGGWGAVMAAVPPGPARQRVQHLSAQASQFRERRTIAAWMDTTDAALIALGMAAAYQEDAAGQQLMTLLLQVARDCNTLSQDFTFSEWRAFVSMRLESTTFVPPVNDKRVVMLPLHGMHLRSFDAVLIVGADSAHLPSSSSETLFFANPVRRELGLVTNELRQRQQLRDFAAVLATNPCIVISWQSVRNGEPIAVSNWVERLDLVLAVEAMPCLAAHCAQLPSIELEYLPISMPTPTAPDLLPQRLSASGYDNLVKCPYQFFAYRMLGLARLEEFSELPEKRDYGIWLHQILNLFHIGMRDKVSGTDDPGAFLMGVTEQVFANELVRNGAALGFYDRWIKAIPAYIEWAAMHEAAGWQFAFGEQWREQVLHWEGGNILLHGCLDRIDRNAAGETTVIDYKTTSLAVLKQRIGGNEDHQLAFYGLLSDTPPGSAQYVSLEPYKGKIGDVDAPHFATRQQQLHAQIGDTMQAIADGSALRALGVESVCDHCKVRGLCRKGAW